MNEVCAIGCKSLILIMLYVVSVAAVHFAGYMRYSAVWVCDLWIVLSILIKLAQLRNCVVASIHDSWHLSTSVARMSLDKFGPLLLLPCSPPASGLPLSLPRPLTLAGPPHLLPPPSPLWIPPLTLTCSLLLTPSILVKGWWTYLLHLQVLTACLSNSIPTFGNLFKPHYYVRTKNALVRERWRLQWIKVL